MTPQSDHLEFYEVGTLAADKDENGCLTGAFEHGIIEESLKRAGIEPKSRSSYFANPNTEYLSGVKIIATSCTHIHSYALDDKGKLRYKKGKKEEKYQILGKLYGWGCGSDGRLGLKAFFNPNGTKRRMKCYVSTPTQVEELESLNVSCGKYWSFAIVK